MVLGVSSKLCLYDSMNIFFQELKIFLLPVGFVVQSLYYLAFYGETNVFPLSHFLVFCLFLVNQMYQAV